MCSNGSMRGKLKLSSDKYLLKVSRIEPPVLVHNFVWVLYRQTDTLPGTRIRMSILQGPHRTSGLGPGAKLDLVIKSSSPTVGERGLSRLLVVIRPNLNSRSSFVVT